MSVIVAVSMTIILRTNVLQLVHTTALWAALNGAIARCYEPNNNVRVSRASGAANVLLITKRLHGDGVVERACTRCQRSSSPGYSVPLSHLSCWHPKEDVHTLHLSENFQSLETGRLFEIGRDSTWLGSRWEKVVLILNFYSRCTQPLSSCCCLFTFNPGLSPSNFFSCPVGSPI